MSSFQSLLYRKSTCNTSADRRWFLSLYINSMPLIFAFRIVDCVLAMGVKVLFQIGLGELIYV